MNMLFKKQMEQFIGSAAFVNKIIIDKTNVYILWNDQCIGQGILDHNITVLELFQELLEHIGENKCDIKLSHYVDLYNPGGEWYAGEMPTKIIRVGENHDMDKIKIGQIVRLLSNNPCAPKIVDT